MRRIARWKPAFAEAMLPREAAGCAYFDRARMSDTSHNSTAKSAAPAICGVVVTFFPSDSVHCRLERIAKQVDFLIVVDNSAAGEVTARLAPVAARLGVRLITNAQNLGIATALNQGVAQARASGADWVFFFDQDSNPVEEFRAAIWDIVSQYRGVRPLGIVGSNFRMAGTGMPAFPIDFSNAENHVMVDAVITSGSAYKIEMLAKLGPFRDDYFIDCVDTEYCLRALANGYAVCQSAQTLLTHSLGAPSYHKVLGRKLGTSNHSALRRYFMARNNVLLAREYFRRLPDVTRRVLKTYVITIIVMCLVEKGRGRKIMSTLQGLWHGVRRRIDQKS